MSTPPLTTVSSGTQLDELIYGLTLLGKYSLLDQATVNGVLYVTIANNNISLADRTALQANNWFFDIGKLQWNHTNRILPTAAIAYPLI